MIGFNHGSFQNLQDISIPVTSLSINRGYGAFEFFEVAGGKAFYGDRHLARFLNSLKILRLKTGFENQLAEIVDELIRRNGEPDCFIKLFALPHELNFAGGYQAALYAFSVHMPQYEVSLYQQGAALVTKKFQRFLPEAKSTNYLAGQFWMNEQENARVVDVLFHNGETVQETSRGNIFVVKGGKVITPAKDVLKGVTRSLVLEILKQQQIPFAEEELGLDELFLADEVFLSSTTKHILPVTIIDDAGIGNGKPGNITISLMGEFQKLKDRFH